MTRTSYRILCLAALSLTARSAASQAPDARGPVDPRIWTSLSAGPMTFPQLNLLNESRENVGSAIGIRGSVELDAGRVGGIGLTVANVTLPIDYISNGATSVCATGCPADVRVTSVMATFHAGGGVGLDQVFQASAGFTFFGDIVGVPASEALRTKASDFTFMVGYGGAYGFSPQLSVFAVGDVGLVFHGQEDTEDEVLEGGYYSPLVGVRLGVRYGLWSRPR